MALTLKDFPPHLQAAIHAQIAKENAHRPVVRYMMATRTQQIWTFGPLSEDIAIIRKLVRAHNAGTAKNARLTVAGYPPAQIVEITAAQSPVA